MTRLNKYENLKKHAWYGRLYARLNEREHDLARSFIKSNDSLNVVDFKSKIVQMFTNNLNKPKNWAIIEDLLMACD